MIKNVSIGTYNDYDKAIHIGAQSSDPNHQGQLVRISVHAAPEARRAHIQADRHCDRDGRDPY